MNTPSSFTLSSGRRALLATALLALMTGCATVSTPVSVADTLANTPSLSTLNGLVASAGLTNTLKGSGPFTVFAPNNDAFKAVPAKTMDDLAKHPEKLKDLLTYHVLPGKTLAAQVKNSNAKTVNGAELALAKAGDIVTVENAMVTQADIQATNGVVHIIDTVLLPPAKK
ncbi:fasciclin domain-containing protein [Rhodoferax saidenbachensis]|uniref:Fasciclin n=1 Tax=Rhodoferax saidenbachensis TaxID=1484693 RepID=A0A1P8K8P7_9BURK|nr:fasciclin domain-containing protein [Rhodoferax saidenbachensis]APW42372.1 fasciclin [Rhodoferax saidenbachensis]